RPRPGQTGDIPSHPGNGQAQRPHPANCQQPDQPVPLSHIDCTDIRNMELNDQTGYPPRIIL
ncbi:hypothetical protein IWW51_003424, partial [Coemansia sp. RSA 2702]